MSEQEAEARAVLGEDDETIDHLITSEGVVLKYDFYVDCTGFRSALLEKKLGSVFQSYQSSLFTDSAITANASRVGPNSRQFSVVSFQSMQSCRKATQLGDG